MLVIQLVVLVAIAAAAAVCTPNAAGYAVVICAVFAGCALGQLARARTRTQRGGLLLIVALLATLAIWQTGHISSEQAPMPIVDVPAPVHTQRT